MKLYKFWDWEFQWIRISLILMKRRETLIIFEHFICVGNLTILFIYFAVFEIFFKKKKYFKICNLRTSPVIQWLGILLPMQRTLGRSLVWEDSRATNPRNHSYWSWSAESPSLQQEATAVRGLCTTREWPPYISEDPVYRKQNK